jgi:hypothetical protein
MKHCYEVFEGYTEANWKQSYITNVLFAVGTGPLPSLQQNLPDNRRAERLVVWRDPVKGLCFTDANGYFGPQTTRYMKLYYPHREPPKEVHGCSIDDLEKLYEEHANPKKGETPKILYWWERQWKEFIAELRAEEKLKEKAKEEAAAA